MVNITKWRKQLIKNADGLVIEAFDWTFTEINGYIVTAVHMNGVVGLSYCAPSDIGDRFDPARSIGIAKDRMQFKFQKDWSIQNYVRLAMMVDGYPVPGKVARVLRRTMTVNITDRIGSKTAARRNIIDFLEKYGAIITSTPFRK